MDHQTFGANLMGAESKLEKRCTEIAKRNGWWSRKFSSPANRGVPDRIFLKDGDVIFVEFKAPDNVPTPLQEHEMLQINAKGGNATWTDNVPDFLKILGILT